AEQVAGHLLHLARDPLFRAGVEERSRRYARDHLDPNTCRDQYLAFAQEVGNRESPATMIVPEHHEPGRPLTWDEAQAHLGRVRPRIDDLTGATLGQDGALAFVDLLYRTVL